LRRTAKVEVRRVGSRRDWFMMAAESLLGFAWILWLGLAAYTLIYGTAG